MESNNKYYVVYKLVWSNTTHTSYAGTSLCLIHFDMPGLPTVNLFSDEKSSNVISKSNQLLSQLSSKSRFHHVKSTLLKQKLVIS